MNLLIDQLPVSVSIGDLEWPIRWGYRYWIMFEILMTDPEISEEEKLYHALELCYEELPPDLGAAKEAILYFYRCGRQGKLKHGGANGDARLYSFEHDASYIYAAFWQQYGIDLTQEHLHWWQFRALFNALSPDTLFVSIMGWRYARVDAKTSPEERDRLQKLKEQYALPVSRTENEKTEKIFDILMNL